MKNDLTALHWAPGQLHIVENYWEAAGVLAAMKAGIVPESVRRPLEWTKTETAPASSNGGSKKSMLIQNRQSESIPKLKSNQNPNKIIKTLQHYPERRKMNIVWDDRYDTEEYVYGKQPNDFLKEMLPKLKGDSVLCLAEGEGRNAVFLAQNGFTVTGVDSSIVGLNKTNKLAEENGVAVRTIHADLTHYEIIENDWDCIVSISCHLPPDLRKQVHRSVVKGLRVGGVFVLEAYTPEQLKYDTGGPKSAKMMMELDGLKEELHGLEFVHGQEIVRNVSEGSKHTGEAAVVQVLALKT